MQKVFYILVVFFLSVFTAFSQVSESIDTIEIKGSVKEQRTRVPISGVEISTSSGGYTLTNWVGEFRIRALIGDQLIIRSPEFETVRYTIRSGEDVDVLVEDVIENKSSSGASSNKTSKRETSMYRVFLDSANFYKRTHIEKSIDFITQSIAALGRRADKRQLAASLTTLGEVYEFHNQYDLAITNFKDALKAHKTTRTTILLAKVYVLNKEFRKSEELLNPLIKIRGMVPFQRTELYEILGDAYAGMRLIDKAVAFFEEGLKIAKKNQISPKMTDLNSKIGDAYAKDDRLQEAEAFYANSLRLSNNQAPRRAVREKEKVADFYNQKSQYGDEIELRKKSLNELLKIPRPLVEKIVIPREADTITTQRINYKIANAYIAQDQYDQAILYLKQSITEADSQDDLIVQKDATRKLSEVYKYKGDYTKALETYQDYVAVVDTLYVRKEQEISRAARFNRELASKQSRISGLEQGRQLSQSKYDLALTEQQLIAENYKRQQWVIYSLIFGMILMGLTTFFFYRSNQQQKLANNLLALKSLRSQMNPHFIFNALNSVNNFIAKSDERSANRYLSDFSTLMRAVLENSEEDFIPLAKELELLELYTKLEHSRFPDKFDYKIHVDERIDVEAFQIPPMLLQPYIENAIWHGLRYTNEKGFLNILLKQKDENTIEITIEDNGIGRKKSAELKTPNQKKRKSKGMGNIKKRIAILNDMYTDKVAVHISNLNADGTGTKVLFLLKRD
ncbi:MAG: histidine kinase [Flavobacteriaceae bacterium]